MKTIVEEQVVAAKSSDFGPRPGGFNVLNVSKQVELSAGIEFFELVNKPFLDAAIRRGDDIALTTIPTKMEDFIAVNGALKGNFAKEVDYLVKMGIKPSNVSSAQWNKSKGFFL